VDQEFLNAVKEMIQALDNAQITMLRVRGTQTYTAINKVENLIQKAESAIPGPRFLPEGPFHMYDTWGQCYWVLESHAEAMKEKK